MKSLYRLNVLTFLVALLLIALPVSAKSRDGGIDSGGGDLRAVREQRIRALVSHLSRDLIYFVDSVRPADLTDESARETFEYLLLKGLREDIRTSRYRLAERCEDREGVERAASAGVGDRGGEICLNLPMLVNGAASERDIYSLIVHEHAHHLGIADESAAYAAGQAMSGPIAAKLFFQPRAGRTSVLVPTPAPKDCLNLRNLWERMRAMDPNTPTTLSLIDIEFPESASEGFRGLALKIFGGRTEQPLKDTMDTRPIYQNGCDSVMVPVGQNRFVEASIISHSPTHLEISAGAYGDEPATFQPKTMTIRMPEGENGSRLILSMTGELATVFKCSGTFPNEADNKTEKHVISHTSQLVLDADRSRWATVSTRLQREYGKALDGLADAGYTGCIPTVLDSSK